MNINKINLYITFKNDLISAGTLTLIEYIRTTAYFKSNFKNIKPETLQTFYKLDASGKNLKIFFSLIIHISKNEWKENNQI